MPVTINESFHTTLTWTGTDRPNEVAKNTLTFSGTMKPTSDKQAIPATLTFIGKFSVAGNVLAGGLTGRYRR